MAVLSFTSSKGGVGKSTACAAIACAIAGQGRRVLVLDLDLNKTLLTWFKRSSYKGVTVQGCSPAEFAEVFKDHQAGGQWDDILIDLAGTLDAALLRAFVRADLVIIPAGLSAPDLHQALVMVKHLNGVAESVERGPIPYRLLLTRVSPLGSRVGNAMVDEIERHNLLSFSRVMMERAAYKEIFVTGKPPTDTEPLKAGAEVMAIVEEIRAIIAQPAHAKAVAA
jgi:chromosome partitioning protein